MQLGNLAIVTAKHKKCMLVIYNNEVTLYLGQGTDRKHISSAVNENENIIKIIDYLKNMEE